MQRFVLGRIFVALILTSAAIGDDSKLNPERSQYERLLKDNDAKIAGELSKRADAAAEQGKYDEAINDAEKLLALRERIQGRDHYQTKTALWKLDALKKVAALPEDKRASYRAAEAGGQEAERLLKQESYAGALPLLQKQLDSRRQILGDDHPETADCALVLAFALNVLKDFVPAEAATRGALAGLQRTLGDGHPRIASAYERLSASLDGQGKLAESEAILRKALAIYQRSMGDSADETVKSLLVLAWNRIESGMFDDAAQIVRAGIGRWAEGTETLSAAQFCDVMGLMFIKDKYDEGEPLLRRALAVRRRVLGEEHAKNLTGGNALREAKRWVRELSYAEAISLLSLRELGPDFEEDSKPFSHPRHWSPFILVGDPR